MANTKIAILGWGSLLWDEKPTFDKWHENWKYDGPVLRIEFCKMSKKTRHGALTLVIDQNHGAPCTVAYAMSKRKTLKTAIKDLYKREGMKGDKLIGQLDLSKNTANEPEPRASIRAWANAKHLDFVIWTDIPRDLDPFSVQGAVSYIQGLSPYGKAMAAEYIWRAPPFVQTPLRNALEVPPWFPI